MPRFTFLHGLAAAFLLIFFAMFAWQHPGALGSRLKPAEIERYLVGVERNIPGTPREKADAVARVRAWALADDGRPFYMLNLMRFRPRVLAMPGGPPTSMTPEEANAIYEAKGLPAVLGLGGTAPFVGASQGRAVLTIDAAEERWSRVLVVRYPNRRAFLKLVSDPGYGKLAPYKLASLQIVLAPSAGGTQTPDLTLATGAVLLLAYLAIGWWRAATRRDPTRN